MGSRIATKCLARPAQFLSPISLPLTSQFLPHNTITHHPAFFSQRRHQSWFGWGKSKSTPKSEPTDETTPDARYLRELLKASPRSGAAATSPITNFERGALSGSSIFGDEGGAGEPGRPGVSAGEGGIAPPSSGGMYGEKLVYQPRDYLTVVDPNRAKAWSWPKRFEARIHRRRGRLTRKETLLQTEKSHTAKSHFIKTSVKKLAPLARQISGMKVNDAIVQMRFSPKKASSEVLGHLLFARNEAIVRRRMDVNEMYVDQAWVGRGVFERELSHRARGRVDILRRPFTSITLVLKEEATRERIAKEQEEKRLRQKLWVQLPNKPIYGQRQYYQW